MSGAAALPTSGGLPPAPAPYDTTPTLPQDRSPGIGLIGCGGIARWGHLPAYRKYGLRVVAAASRRAESIAALARDFDLGRTSTDWRRVIDDPAVRFVDVTVPHDEDRLAIVEAAAAAGKHILMQKPLAHSMATAERLVAIAAAAGVTLAVNQNARWCPQYRAAHLAIARGEIGAPYFLTHRMQNTQDSEAFRPGWMHEAERFQILEYTVHHLDLMRFWTGREPTRVQASVIRKPGQQRRGEMIASIHLQFGGDLLAVVSDDNAAAPSAPVQSEFHIAGTHGNLDGRVMRDPYLELRSARNGGVPHRPDLPGAWFPDAFAGTMGELMCAVEQGRAPTISGHDNLHTLRLVFAAYASASAATPLSPP